MDYPEPLFEAGLHHRRVCLGCARQFARTVLRTTEHEIVPICAACSAAWNFHGYQILRRIKPARLVWRLVVFKLMHPFRTPGWREIVDNLKRLKEWARKMRRWT